MRWLVSSKEERVAIENVCGISWEGGCCGSSVHSPTWKEKGKGEEDTSCLMVNLAMNAQDIKQSQAPLDLPNKLCAVVSCNDWVSKVIPNRSYPGNISFLNAHILLRFFQI